MPEPGDLLGIGAFARRVGLTPSALRFYDACGVLPPTQVDDTTGYRSYDPSQERRGRMLRELRTAGLPLAEVRAVLNDPDGAARHILHAHLRRTEDTARTARAAVEKVLGALPHAGENRATARVGGPELAGAVRQVTPAAAPGEEHDEELGVLGCLLLDLADGEVRLVATDRYRLSLRVLYPARIDGGPGRVLVRVAEMRDLGRWAARAAEIDIELRDGVLTAHDAAGRREVPTVEGAFPDYRMMLNDLAPARHRVLVDRLGLLRALTDRVSAPHVALLAGDDELLVRAPDATEITLRAVCTGAPPLLTFDPGRLSAALESGVGPDTLLEISGAAAPVLVRSADQGTFTTLVMPVAPAPR